MGMQAYQNMHEIAQDYDRNLGANLTVNELKVLRVALLKIAKL